MLILFNLDSNGSDDGIYYPEPTFETLAVTMSLSKFSASVPNSPKISKDRSDNWSILSPTSNKMSYLNKGKQSQTDAPISRRRQVSDTSKNIYASKLFAVFKIDSLPDSEASNPPINETASDSHSTLEAQEESFSLGGLYNVDEIEEISKNGDLLDVVCTDNVPVQGWQMRRSTMIVIPKSLELKVQVSEKGILLVVFTLHLIDDSIVFLKMSHDMKMESVLKIVCSQNKYLYEDHTFECGAKPNLETVELDIPLKHYASRELWVKKKTKTFSTAIVKHKDEIIMTYQNLAAGPKIMLATTATLLEFLNDCTRKIGNA